MGMFTLKNPRRLYALSSDLVVVRFAAQDILFAMLKSSGSAPSSMAASIFVMLEMISLRFSFVPIFCQAQLKNSTVAGAMSSCSVQPRVNHTLSPKLASSDGSVVSTSAKYA
ncbi:hypothetical protein FSOLCH5_010791 [Fusarium solani]